MANHFDRVASVNAPRSTFNGDHTHKTTFDANDLVPILCEEILPGDTVDISTSAFTRLLTPIVPSMDNLYIDIHFFFTPNRLVWDNFERFMGQRDNPEDSVDFLVPSLREQDIDNRSNSDIFSYMGVPKPDTVTGNLRFNALPFRAYNLIYNEWYRDQNFFDSLEVPKDDGEDEEAQLYSIQKRRKARDYFTSSLPWPQKGDPVSLTLAGRAPVETPAGTGMPLTVEVGGGVNSVFLDSSGPNLNAGMIHEDGEGYPLWARLEGATAITINALRQSFQLQKFLERDARSGTRYIEVIYSHFGVTNPDYRLQRPEFLGHISEMVNFSTIPQTSATTEDSPQGNLAALGVTSSSGNRLVKSFSEHGHLIAIASVRSDLTYQRSIRKNFLRQTRVDYFWPSFAHLGEQTVMSREIYWDGSVPQDDVFGYNERYSEYRYIPSRLSGLFNSSEAQSLDVWHYAEDFANKPILGASFLEYNTPVKRNSAVPSEPDFKGDFTFKIKFSRCLPMYGTPGFVDHF